MTHLRLYIIIVLLLAVSTAARADAQDADLCRNIPIRMNGADWSGLRRLLADTLDVPFSIVHIGDSHLQADVPTAHLRRAFQHTFGDAGRGLVTPFKLSGTYQPTDYSITSSTGWKAARFLRYPWTPAMSFAGTALAPLEPQTTLTVKLNPEAGHERLFDDIQIFHRGSMEIDGVTDSEGDPIGYTIDSDPEYWTSLTLDRAVDEATVSLTAEDDFVFHAMSLTNGDVGVIYHTIGNGGADMHQYNLISGLGDGVAQLLPDLIILALGTNDSYNHFTPERFATNLDRIVTSLREANPGVPILLVTPMEIQMTKSHTVKSKSKRGKKRTVAKKVRSRSVVEGCEVIHRMMHDYATDHHLAIYDWYEATGGTGASQRWVDAGLMRSDYVHLTPAGYKKHAEMLYEALRKALNIN